MKNLTQNVYIDGTQKLIPAVLLYASYQKKILMIKGNKWNGLGGKLELGESFLDAAVREFEEESGATTKAQQWIFLGQLFFPNFKEVSSEDWIVNVYAIDLERAQVDQMKQSPVEVQSKLCFFHEDEILNLNLWSGDTQFLPYVFQRKPFVGTFYYSKGNLDHFQLAPIFS